MEENSQLIDLDLEHYIPEIDTFLDFKNRVVKKIEKLTGVSQNPDFNTIFKNLVNVLDVVITEDNNLESTEITTDEEKVRRYLEGVIAVTQLFQEFHEVFVIPPPYLTQIITTTTSEWIKLATEFLAFNAMLPLIKDVEAQEKYYIVLPVMERIMASLKNEAENGTNINMEKIILLILVYKIYTTALQKNKFMDDVQDLFVLFVDNIQIFNFNSWKNPLLDNFHRMLVQVGLMLKKDSNVATVIEWRKTYLEAAKENLVHEKQDPNLVLNIINIYFSIAKNYLQLSDTATHEEMLEKSGEWLDDMMVKYPFTKKAWKLKAKMIRSLGHNALKRGNYAACYKYYLRALVVSYHHKLQREYDRALMYVNKYHRFFSQEHLPGLKEDLQMIPERLSQTHLLYLVGKSFTEMKQFQLSILVQRLLVEILEEEYNDMQVKLAVGAENAEMTEKSTNLQELLANNIDFLGNLLMRTRQSEAALEVFKKEAALFENEKPRKQIKIYMKVAKELSKNSRFKEALDLAEKAYHLASEHNINENTEKMLQFLVELCKMADMPAKLADYKSLLYNN